MKQKFVWIALGFLLCFSCVSLLSSKWLVQAAGASANIATSADGKYVYIVGDKSERFYRSEDFGKTFFNMDIVPNE